MNPIPSYLRHWFRRLHSLQEMKLAAAPEHARFIRAKRNVCNLPDSWDDTTNARKKFLTRRQKILARSGYRNTIRRMEVVTN